MTSHSDLGRTCLTGHRIVGVLQPAGGTVVDHPFESILHLFDHFGRTDRLDHHLRWEGPQRLAILFEFLDKHRTDHLPSIGYGIVEAEGFQRCQTQAVSVRHHGQCHTAPRCITGAINDRRGSARNLQIKRHGQTHFVEMFHELCRPIFIVFIDRQSKTHIGGVFEDLTQRHVTAGMGIDHAGTANHHPTVSGIEMLVETGSSIIEQRHQRGRFKGRSRLQVHADRIVEILDKLAFTPAGKIGDGTYLTGRDLHQYRRSPIGITQFKLFSQGIFSHILHIDIKCSDHIDSISWRLVQSVGNRNFEATRYALHQNIAILTLEDTVESSLDAPFTAGFVDPTDRT